MRQSRANSQETLPSQASVEEVKQAMKRRKSLERLNTESVYQNLAEGINKLNQDPSPKRKNTLSNKKRQLDEYKNQQTMMIVQQMERRGPEALDKLKEQDIKLY